MVVDTSQWFGLTWVLSVNPQSGLPRPRFSAFNLDGDKVVEYVL